MKTTKIAQIGMLVALAFVFSYIEFLLPFSIGIPGTKIGLANLTVMVALYLLGEKEAFGVSLIRMVLVAFTFGNMASLLYSMAGGLLSYFVMLPAKKSKKLTALGVSILGGVFHNVGQIIMAAFMMQTETLLYYLPVLLLAGCVSGIVIGILASYTISTLKKLSKNNWESRG